MSTSSKMSARRLLRRYIILTIFCGLFGFVYELFSHGVYSNYMVLMFLFPLLGGALPALLLRLLPAAAYPKQASLNAWGCAVATLTVGSCLSGVFEIYGSTSSLIRAYWLAGAALYALAILLYFLQRKQKTK